MEAVRSLSLEMIGLGHSVELACSDAPDASWLKTVPFPVHGLGRGRGLYGYNNFWIPWLRANLRRYDAVIVNGIWQFQSFATWRSIRDTGVPYSVFPHGMLDPYFKRSFPFKHLKKWLYWPWAVYPVLRDARYVMFTCEAERENAKRSFWLYRANEKVVGLGISEASLTQDSDPKNFFASFPHLENKRLFVFMGRINPTKGLPVLIRAFAEECRDAALHLVIAGPAESKKLQSELEDLSTSLGIADRITWTGMVSGGTKTTLLEIAEVLVLPSHYENFGIVVVEALTRGTPVLISDKVQIWNEIESSGAGLVAPDTVEGTRENLRRWLDLPPGQREAMRLASRRCVQEKFRLRDTAERVVSSFESSAAHATLGGR